MWGGEIQGKGGGVGCVPIDDGTLVVSTGVSIVHGVGWKGFTLHPRGGIWFLFIIFDRPGSGRRCLGMIVIYTVKNIQYINISLTLGAVSEPRAQTYHVPLVAVLNTTTAVPFFATTAGILLYDRWFNIILRCKACNSVAP